VAQFRKPPGRITFAVAPGSYVIQAREGDGFRKLAVTVPVGGTITLDERLLERQPLEVATLKGGAMSSRWSLAVAGAFTSKVVQDTPAGPSTGLFLRWMLPKSLGFLNTVSASAGFAWGTQAAAISERELELRLGVGYTHRVGLFQVRLLLEGGALLVQQRGISVSTDPDRNSVAPTLGLVLDGQLHLVGPLFLFGQAMGGGTLVQLSGDKALRPRWGVGLGLGLEL
jgi:hypothetical protein